MRDWCIFSVDVRNARKLGHEPLDPPSLAGDRRTGRTYRSALRGARVWLNIPLARTRVRHKAQAPKASIASVAARQVSPLLKNYRPACLAGLQTGESKNDCSQARRGGARGLPVRPARGCSRLGASSQSRPPDARAHCGVSGQVARRNQDAEEGSSHPARPTATGRRRSRASSAGIAGSTDAV